MGRGHAFLICSTLWSSVHCAVDWLGWVCMENICLMAGSLVPTWFLSSSHWKSLLSLSLSTNYLPLPCLPPSIYASSIPWSASTWSSHLLCLWHQTKCKKGQGSLQCQTWNLVVAFIAFSLAQIVIWIRAGFCLVSVSLVSDTVLSYGRVFLRFTLMATSTHPQSSC
jgi:hypothetical protein